MSYFSYTHIKIENTQGGKTRNNLNFNILMGHIMLHIFYMRIYIIYTLKRCVYEHFVNTEMIFSKVMPRNSPEQYTLATLEAPLPGF